MKEIKTVPVGALEALLEDERNGASDEEFVERYVQGIIKTLKSNPLLYRSFGAYWWPLKRLIVNAKVYHNDFGESYSEEFNKALSLDSDALTVCAIYLEQEDNIATGNTTSTAFNYEAMDGSEIEITIEDDIMEKIAFLLKA